MKTVTLARRSALGGLRGLCVVIMVGLGGASAEAIEPTRGATLYRACGGAAPQTCLAYVAGVIDLHDEAMAPQLGPMFCIEGEPDPKEVGVSVWLWYQRHPEALDAPAVYGVTQALAGLFPCK